MKKVFFSVFVGSLIWFVSCSSKDISTRQNMPASHKECNSESTKLATNESIMKALEEISLEGLFGELFEQKTYNEFIEKEQPKPAILQSIVEDGAVSHRIRLAALGVLYYLDGAVYDGIGAEVKAMILAMMLSHDYFSSQDLFGKLWYNDDAGILGDRIIQQGEVAVKFLAKSLEDERIWSSYYGSEEATVMSMRQYRVKDFAAFYIAKIKDYPLQYAQNLSERDSSIAKMALEMGL